MSTCASTAGNVAARRIVERKLAEERLAAPQAAELMAPSRHGLARVPRRPRGRASLWWEAAEELGGPWLPLAKRSGSLLRVAVLDPPQSIQRHPPDAHSVLAESMPGKAREVRHGFEQVKSAFGAIDVLVFLVGFALTPPRPTAEIDETQWTEVVHGNLTTAHLVTREALPLLREGNSPSIVTISSGLGVSVLRGFGPYAAAKAGLIALTKTLAIEAAPAVRANAIAPSAILTDFMTGVSDGTIATASGLIPVLTYLRSRCNVWPWLTTWSVQSFFIKRSSSFYHRPNHSRKWRTIICHDASYSLILSIICRSRVSKFSTSLLLKPARQRSLISRTVGRICLSK